LLERTVSVFEFLNYEFSKKVRLPKVLEMLYSKLRVKIKILLSIEAFEI